jgi:hypothetical protein
MKFRIALVALTFLFASYAASAQENSASTSAPVNGAAPAVAAATPVPRLIRFSGVATDADGKPLDGAASGGKEFPGAIGITFAVYSQQTNGPALWMETQNVSVDAAGHYSVMLGATQPEGLPVDLFDSGEAHWLGVQISGQPEQPRVLLVSVPYALKAGDAATIGGLPPSAFVLANSLNATSATTTAASGSSAKAPTSVLFPSSVGGKPQFTASGTQNFIPLWIDSLSDLGNSILFQDPNTGDVGIGTTTPGASLDVNGTINAATQFNLGGSPFAYGAASTDNAYLGFAGNAMGTTLSETSTGVGFHAMFNNNGLANTGVGVSALFSNTTGSENTAVGVGALGNNITGSNNTGLGTFAGPGLESGLTYATAIGAGSQVDRSNSLVLGTVPGTANCIAFGCPATVTNIGIGTTTPQFNLDVHGTGNFTGAVAFGSPVTFVTGQVFPGLTGPAGPPGPRGLPGPTGATGRAGAIGPEGPAGPAGAKGQIGPQGPAGLPGPVGPRGPSGTNGAPGATGPAGPMGLQGPQGIQGPPGSLSGSGALNSLSLFNSATTVAGSNVFQSTTAPTIGDIGIGTSTPQFPLDVTGIIRSTGGFEFPDGTIQGPAGPTGPTGATGQQGPVGANGATGSTGATGAAGPAGPMGLQGPQGIQGPPGSLSGTGTANFLPLFSTGTTVANSNVFQTTTGTGSINVGIGQTNPQATLDVNGSINLPATMSSSVGVLSLGGAPFLHNFGTQNTFVGISAGNMTTTGIGLNTAVGYLALPSNSTGADNVAFGSLALTDNTTGSSNSAFGVAALENISDGNSNIAIGVNAGGQLNSGNSNIYIGSGGVTNESNTIRIGDPTVQTAAFIAGNLSVSGTVTCASGCGGGGSGGGGTITGVTAGTGLSGGGTTGNVTLNLAGSSCASGQAFTAIPLTCSPFATLGANTFTGTQTMPGLTVNGNISTTGSISAGTLSVGTLTATTFNSIGSYELTNQFFLGSTPTTTNDVFLGFSAGNQNGNNFGLDNMAFGSSALHDLAGGGFNTASGASALFNNTTGSNNTASGSSALLNNITGSNNTALGSNAGPDSASTALTNSTAIGANAVVSESNALVLGGTGSNAVSVGIGTATPAAALDVNGSVNLGSAATPANLSANSTNMNLKSLSSMILNSGTNMTVQSSDDMALNAAITLSITAPSIVLTPSAPVVIDGDLTVSGNVSKGGGSFKIDDPLDPANKYLYHSFVESPDMMNIYNGVSTLDADGNVWITLPEYFQALNRDFRYQLTSIGKPQPDIYIAEEISANRFKISGGKPGGKVSWQVTGIRQDAYANAHRIPVEEAKPLDDQGHYLHPELFGAPPEKAVGYHAAAAAPDAAQAQPSSAPSAEKK